MRSTKSGIIRRAHEASWHDLSVRVGSQELQGFLQSNRTWLLGVVTRAAAGGPDAAAGAVPAPQDQLLPSLLAALLKCIAPEVSPRPAGPPGLSAAGIPRLCAHQARRPEACAD